MIHAACARRRVLGSAAALPVAVFAAACGGAVGGSGKGAVAPLGAPNLSGPMTLQIYPYHPMPPDIDSAERGYLHQFEQIHPNIKVELLNTTGENYPAKTTALVAAGSAPDIFGPHTRTDFMINGVFLRLNDRFDRDKMDVDDFYPSAMAYYQHDGYSRGLGQNRVGLPYVSGADVLYYNKTLFAKAGVPTPQQALDKKEWTYDKLLEMARQTTKRNGDQVESYGIDWNEIWGPRVWSYGGDFFSPDGLTSRWGSPVSAEALQWHQDLRHKYRVNPLPAEVGNGFTFQEGRVAMVAQPADFSGRLKVAANGWDWDAAPLPTGPSGVFHRFFSTGVCVYSKSKFIDGAWELLKYYTGKEVQTARLTSFSILPSRRSVAEGPAFKTFRPPEHASAFLTAAVAARLWPQSAPSSEFISLMGKQFDRLNLNQATGQEVGNAIDAINQPFLDKLKAGTYVMPDPK